MDCRLAVKSKKDLRMHHQVRLLLGLKNLVQMLRRRLVKINLKLIH